MAPFAPPGLPKYRPFTKKGLPRKRPGPAPKPKHELAKWKNKKPLSRVERSYPLERKIEVLMFLLNHRITETEPPQRAPRRRLGQPPECEASYTITETGQRLYHRAPTYAEASAWYKVPMPTIHGWWDNREKILEGTGVELPKVPDTLPVPGWLAKDGTGTTNRASSVASSSSSVSDSFPRPPAPAPKPPAPAVQRPPPAAAKAPAKAPAPAPAQRAPPPVAAPAPLPTYKQPSYRRISNDEPPSQIAAPVQIVFSLKGVGIPKSVPPVPFPNQVIPPLRDVPQPQVTPPQPPAVAGPPYVQRAPPPPNLGIVPPLDLPSIPWSVYPPGSGPFGPPPPPGTYLGSPVPNHPVPINGQVPPNHAGPVINPDNFSGPMREVRTVRISGFKNTPAPGSAPGISNANGTQPIQSTNSTPAPASAPAKPAQTAVPAQTQAVNNNNNNKSSTAAAPPSPPPTASDAMEVDDDGAEEPSSSSTTESPTTAR